MHVWHVCGIVCVCTCVCTHMCLCVYLEEWHGHMLPSETPHAAKLSRADPGDLGRHCQSESQ